MLYPMMPVLSERFIPDLDAGLVGLSVTYAMTLMGLFQWGVRQSAEVENQVRTFIRLNEQDIALW